MCTCASLVIGFLFDWSTPSKVLAILCAVSLLIDVIYRTIKMMRRPSKNER